VDQRAVSVGDRTGPPVTGPLEVLAEDLAWPEGPSVLADASVAFVESDRGRVTVWRQRLGTRTLAVTGGRPNGTVRVDDALYIAQSGPAAPDGGVADAAPSIQRVDLAGTVETIVTAVEGRPLERPNDIVVGLDGRLYFTDPGRWDPDARPDSGAIFAVDRAGTGHLILDVGRVYPNGLGFDASGRLVWVESYTRRVKALRTDGRVETLHVFEDPAFVPDGLCVAPSGELIIAGTSASGLAVIAADGRVEVVRAGAVPTNCTLHEGYLYVTDGGATRTPGAAQAGGSLWRIPTVQPALFGE
jgi:gluconolactonase